MILDLVNSHSWRYKTVVVLKRYQSTIFIGQRQTPGTNIEKQSACTASLFTCWDRNGRVHLQYFSTNVSEQLITRSELISSARFTAVMDPGQAFGGSHMGGAEKVFTCLNTQDSLWRSLGVSPKSFHLCRPREWLFLLVGLRHLSENHHSLKALYIFNSQNIRSGSKMGPGFTQVAQYIWTLLVSQTIDYIYKMYWKNIRYTTACCASIWHYFGYMYRNQKKQSLKCITPSVRGRAVLALTTDNSRPTIRVM